MMKKIFLVIGCLVMGASFWGCGAKRGELPPPTIAPAVSSIQVRVVDVSNETRELYEVDVIGMMWSALEESLKKRGMLWKPDSGGVPLTLEAQVLRYEEGTVWLRWFLPAWGRTTLTAKGDLKEGGRLIASAEAKEAITFGHQTFTIGAWRKIFGEVAEDLVSQLTKSL